jgi:hypothetical protein
MFLVSADVAQNMIEYSGLTILRLFGARTPCFLSVVEYLDSDLGPYNELALSFMVRRHNDAQASPMRNLWDWAFGRAGDFLHRMPADTAFAVAAGRQIWGYPKEQLDLKISHADGIFHSTLRRDGKPVVDLSVRPGVTIPAWRTIVSTPDAYSHVDGVTRCMPWRMRASGVCARLGGGATLTLGDDPIADELKLLGLPRRAVMTSIIRNLAMTFEEATPVYANQDPAQLYAALTVGSDPNALETLARQMDAQGYTYAAQALRFKEAALRSVASQRS